MAEEDLEVTSADVESLAEKLEAFSPSLTGAEREILSWVLRKGAEQAADDVAGFALSSFSSPLSGLLASGIGMSSKSAVLKGVGPGGFTIANPGQLRAKESNRPGPGMGGLGG